MECLVCKGELNNNNIYFKTTARKILIRNGLLNKCKKCGSTKILHMHHIDENTNNNILSNLMVLCSKCHLNLHKNWEKRKYVKIKR